MHEDFDAELQLLVQEGLIEPAEVERARAKAREAGRSPIAWMQAEGRISSAGAARLRLKTPTLAPPPDAEVSPPAPPPKPAAPPAGGAPGEVTAPTLPSIGSGQDWPFPGWERFKPIRLLGKGGMGTVWLVVRSDLGNEVALKLVRADGAAQVHKLVEEARALGKVKHDRVCKVHEAGAERGYAYIAMQYVDGETLGSEGLKLTVKQQAQLLRDVALGVQAVHDVGVIHRDIKPSNILVERSAEGLKPYLVDFGVAQSWNLGPAAARSVVGTPSYMSPEQAEGEVATLDHRADVYGLGATLYHLLTGRPPFTGDSIEEILRRVRGERPTPPRALRSSAPEDLSAIALRCLEKDRKDRYDSARALAEDLERYLSRDPVRARSGTLYWLGRRLTKYWALVSLVVAVAGALGWTRYDAQQRERLAHDLTEQVEQIEALARESALAPPHPLQKDREELQGRMAELDKLIRANAGRAEGQGQYALGKGFLALGDYPQARQALESAWGHGFREPRAAYALVIALGHEYLEKLTEAQRQRDPDLRRLAVDAVQRRYKSRVLDLLNLSKGVKDPPDEYLKALIAFYEQQYDDALAKLAAVPETRAWVYETAQLRGDILKARAFARWEAGARQAQQADFDQALAAYRKAEVIARSLPSLHAAEARLERFALMTDVFGGRDDVLEHYERGLKALEPIGKLAPDDPERLVLEAQFHRHLAEFRLTHSGGDEAPLDAALQAAQRAGESAPAATAARAELAQVHVQRALSLINKSKDPRGELRDAAALLESIGEAGRDADFYMSLGKVYAVWAAAEDRRRLDSSANHEKSIEAYRRATGADDHYPRAWSGLGTAYYDRATSARAVDPDRDLTSGKAAVEHALALTPSLIPANYYLGLIDRALAGRAQARGEDPRPALEEALEQLKRGLRISAKYLPMLNAEGEVLLDLEEAEWDRGEDPSEQLRQASEAFQAALSINSGSASAAVNLAETTARQARYLADRGKDPTAATDQALARFRAAASLMSESPLPLVGSGLALIVQARYELDHHLDPRGHLPAAKAAADAAARLEERDPGTARVLGSVQWLEAQMSAGRLDGYQRAAETYEKGLADFQDHWELLREYALVCLDWASRAPAPDALERALRVTARMLEVRPNFPEALAFRAWAQALAAKKAPPAERAGLLERALRDLDAALKANRNLRHAWEPRRAALAAPP